MNRTEDINLNGFFSTSDDLVTVGQKRADDPRTLSTAIQLPALTWPGLTLSAAQRSFERKSPINYLTRKAKTRSPCQRTFGRIVQPGPQFKKTNNESRVEDRLCAIGEMLGRFQKGVFIIFNNPAHRTNEKVNTGFENARQPIKPVNCR